MPRTTPFPLVWQADAGRITRRQIRENLARIWEVACDPCSGARLRDPRPKGEGRVRWDDLCELRLGARLRLIYRWIPHDQSASNGKKLIPGPLMLVDAFGPHVGRGRDEDVLTRLRMIFPGLPDDHGHDKIEVRQCCTGCADEGRLAITKDAFRDALYRVAAS